jgi:large subunit ribosomal protein L4
MKVALFDTKGKETKKKVELSDSIYAVELNEHAFYLDIKLYLANQRQGTHKSKERAEITGSTRKIKKQKGTGTARAGSIKSGVFRGGGRMFGPRPRNYSFKLNKKLRKVARRSALTAKLEKGELIVMENLSFDSIKTKNYSEFLNNFDLLGKKSLLVVAEENKNIYLSARNLKGAKVINALELNTYDISNANKVLLCEGSLNVIEQNLI